MLSRKIKEGKKRCLTKMKNQGRLEGIKKKSPPEKRGQTSKKEKKRAPTSIPFILGYWYHKFLAHEQNQT